MDCVALDHSPSAEPDLAVLEDELSALSGPAKRAALSMLGLSVGDCTGLPFELGAHKHNRQRVDKANEAGGTWDLQRLVLELVVERLGHHGPNNTYARPFSDDTVCADLKAAALAEWAQLRRRSGFSEQDTGDLLWKCYLAQLLAWSDASGGALFQGYGGFTKQLLRPDKGPRAPSPFLNIGEDVPGCSTWPEDWFLVHAEEHCAGSKDWGVASYGNGAVMCFVPQVAAAHVGEAGGGASNSGLDSRALGRLGDTHRHPEARVGAALLHDILSAVIQGSVTSCDELPTAIRSCSQWKALLEGPLAEHAVYPLRPFDAFLARGDCTEDDALAFITRLTNLESPPLQQTAMPVVADGTNGAMMGKLLRTAANWDDEYGGTNGMESRKLCLPDGEPIRFSQRGLNSVLIALWCCCRAKTTWAWISRLLYVGGDADTVGAVCGQIASPLLPQDDVCRAFRRFVAVADCMQRRPCADAAQAAARRYFRRTLLFCAGHWERLARYPRLVDPSYPELAGAGARTDAPPRVLWVDRAFAGGQRGRAEAARLHAAEEAERRGLVRLRRASTRQEALDALQLAMVGTEGFDAVVSELHLGRDSEAGLELLQIVDSLWDGARARRPLFCLLTPYHDGQVSAVVRSRPRTSSVRHDRPEQIIRAVTEGQCIAAVIPEELPLLSCHA